MKNAIKILAAKYVLAYANDLPSEKSDLAAFAKARKQIGDLAILKGCPCHWTAAVAILGGDPCGTIFDASKIAERTIKDTI